MPSVPFAKIISNSTSSIPTAYRVQRIRKPTDSFGKVRAGLDSALVVQYSIADASFIFDRVCQVGQRNVKVLVTLYCLFVHLDRNV
jgi:hypothetical protein